VNACFFGTIAQKVSKSSPRLSSTRITRHETWRVARYSHRIGRLRTPKFVSTLDSSPEPTATNPA
jgi:hypothetical protein